MHDLAVVSRIQKIEPIEGKDRIELATVANYKSIVQKGEYKEGDLCIYVFYDSILPDKPQYEFLRKRCWSEKWKGHRIKPMKMGNVISEGLVLPLDSVKPESRKEGKVVTEELEIRHYDPEASLEQEASTSKKRNPIVNYLCRYKFFRRIFGRFNKKIARTYPFWVPKSDEENIEKVYEGVKGVKEEFILTEKIEGQAAMYLLEGNNFHCFSHNCYVINGNWVEVAKIYNIRNKLNKYCKHHGIKKIAISGEIAGPGIQKNIYHLPSLNFFLYNAYVYKEDKGVKLSWTELEELSREIGIPTVPYLRMNKILPSVDEMLKSCEGDSILYKCMREGVVWRNESGNIHFKCKSRPYKIWFGQ